MRRLVACCITLVLVGALGAPVRAIGAAPFRALVDGLLERFHASTQPCEAAIAPAIVCFVVQPGQVASLAEALEELIEEHDGAVVRGPWSSANGAHRVVLMLADPTWGGVELWLAERPGRRVEGRLEHLPKRRW